MTLSLELGHGTGRNLQAWCAVGAPGFWLLFLRKETHTTEHLQGTGSHRHTSPVGVATIPCSWR